MRLFGFGRQSKKEKPIISEDDRIWTEESFLWLIQLGGMPGENFKPFDFSGISQGSLSDDKSDLPAKAERITDLLSIQLQLQSEEIQLMYYDEGEKSDSIPNRYLGSFSTEKTRDYYIIHIKKDDVNDYDQLVTDLIFSMVQIRILKNIPEFNFFIEPYLSVYLSVIYYGLGVVIFQNFSQFDNDQPPLYLTEWYHVTEQPLDVIHYGFAIYLQMSGISLEDYEDSLPLTATDRIKAMLTFIRQRPADILTEKEIRFSSLYYEGYQACLNSDYELSIKRYKQAMELTNDDHLLSNLLNNIAYNLISTGNAAKSIGFFEQSLHHNPQAVFTLSNLAYAHLLLGNPKKGKMYMEQAMVSEEDIPSYTHRNFGLYYWSIGDIEEAEKNFQLAFELENHITDGLERHYGEFLIDTGEKEKGIIYLERALANRDQLAEKILTEVKNA